MGDGDGGGEGGQRPAERARGVALDDQQAGSLGKQGRDQLGHLAGMNMGVAASPAGELNPLVVRQIMFGGIERMLTGQDEARRQAVAGQRGRDRRQLDGFGAGSDDDVDTLYRQASPWLGGANMAANGA
jgi:hypothetical protein